MTELKTLKDIEWKPGYFIYPKELREEAIKWVKEMKGINKNNFLDYPNELFAILIDSERFIKHFFNLEEEDLE